MVPSIFSGSSGQTYICDLRGVGNSFNGIVFWVIHEENPNPSKLYTKHPSELLFLFFADNLITSHLRMVEI